MIAGVIINVGYWVAVVTFLYFFYRLDVRYIRRLVEPEERVEYIDDIQWVSAEGTEKEKDMPVIREKKAVGGVAVKERPNTRLNAFVTVTHASVDADDDVEDDDTPVQAFEEGDTVCVINPFTCEYVYETNDYMPLYYDILEVKWDEQDGTYRYLISGQQEWIAEDWLEPGSMAVMAKKSTELDSEVLDGDKHTLSIKETLTIAMLTDTITRERSINHYLDLMNTGDDKAKAHATDMLARLTGTGA